MHFPYIKSKKKKKRGREEKTCRRRWKHHPRFITTVMADKKNFLCFFSSSLTGRQDKQRKFSDPLSSCRDLGVAPRSYVFQPGQAPYSRRHAMFRHWPLAVPDRATRLQYPARTCTAVCSDKMTGVERLAWPGLAPLPSMVADTVLSQRLAGVVSFLLGIEHSRH